MSLSSSYTTLFCPLLGIGLNNVLVSLDAKYPPVSIINFSVLPDLVVQLVVTLPTEVVGSNPTWNQYSRACLLFACLDDYLYLNIFTYVFIMIYQLSSHHDKNLVAFTLGLNDRM